MTDQPLKPLRDVVADDLRDQVISRALAPGQRIREEELAARYGVSRVPVREAVQRLASEGYVELIPYRGAVVASPSSGRTLAYLQVRRSLEVTAARLAATRRGGEFARDLVELVRRGDRAAKAQAHSAVPVLVEAFHEHVALASGNEVLLQLLRDCRAKVSWMFAIDLSSRSEDEWDDHRRILDAILSADGEAAARLMDEHIAKDEDLLRDKLASA